MKKKTAKTKKKKCAVPGTVVHVKAYTRRCPVQKVAAKKAQAKKKTSTKLNLADSTGYTGLAKAKIGSYNNAVKDYNREVRLGRGKDEHAQTLIKTEIPKLQKAAAKEMAGQDLRRGRKTDLKKVFRR